MILDGIRCARGPNRIICEVAEALPVESRLSGSFRCSMEGISPLPLCPFSLPLPLSLFGLCVAIKMQIVVIIMAATTTTTTIECVNVCPNTGKHFHTSLPELLRLLTLLRLLMDAFSFMATR